MPPTHTSTTSSPAGVSTASTPSGAAPQGAAPEVRIQIVSNPLYLSGTRELVSGVSRRLGFAEEACSQIALAVDEALANVIRHGYSKAADKPIWISLYPSPCPGMSGPMGDSCQCQTLKIVIEDEAKQVDPAVIKSRDLDEIRPGGLGVHIIKTVMDQVHYEKREVTGMRLTMIKNRVCSTSDAPETPSTPAGACCGRTNSQDRPNA